jgi:hypothetical protein
MHTPQSSERPRHSPDHLFAGARTANHLKVAAYYVEGRVVVRQGLFRLQRTEDRLIEAVSPPEANFSEVG